MRTSLLLTGFSIILGLSTASAQPGLDVSVEGGGMYSNTSVDGNAAIWGSLGLRLQDSWITGIEGGYGFTRHSHSSYDDPYFHIQYDASRNSAYVGPFVERRWSWFSLRGGLGAFRYQQKNSFTFLGTTDEYYNESRWLPAASLAESFEIPVGSLLRVGLGVREILDFDSDQGDVSWETTLMPFARVTLTF